MGIGTTNVFLRRADDGSLCLMLNHNEDERTLLRGIDPAVCAGPIAHPNPNSDIPLWIGFQTPVAFQPPSGPSRDEEIAQLRERIRVLEAEPIEVGVFSHARADGALVMQLQMAHNAAVHHTSSDAATKDYVLPQGHALTIVGRPAPVAAPVAAPVIADVFSEARPDGTLVVQLRMSHPTEVRHQSSSGEGKTYHLTDGDSVTFTGRASVTLPNGTDVAFALGRAHEEIRALRAMLTTPVNNGPPLAADSQNPDDV